MGLPGPRGRADFLLVANGGGLQHLAVKKPTALAAEGYHYPSGETDATALRKGFSLTRPCRHHCIAHAKGVTEA